MNATATSDQPFLRRGARGPAVAELQSLLGVTVDGDFGPATERAVVQFQQSKRLVADGIVGPSTWAALVGATPAPIPSTPDRPILRLGDRGLAVTEVQTLLGIVADGDFGPATERAVKQFQSSYGLVVDGMVGETTWAQLRMDGPVPAVPSTERRTVRLGSTGPAVSELQRLLGIDTDGHFGPRTERAVEVFQARRGLVADGIVGPATWDALYRAGLITDPNVGVIGGSVVEPPLWVPASGMVTNDELVFNSKVSVLERAVRPIDRIDLIVLHRTVTRSVEHTLRVFAARRNGSYFGTPFLVGKAGDIHQTARLDRRTNHVANMNTRSVGIEVVGMPLNARGEPTTGGHYDDPVASWEPLTASQARATAYVVQALMDLLGLSVGSIAAHEDLQAKTEGEGGTVYSAILPYLGFA